MTGFRKKNDVRLRQAILLNIYHENLVILGKDPGRTDSKRYDVFRKPFLIIVVSAFFLMGHWNYVGTSSDRGATAPVIAKQASDIPAISLGIMGENPAVYRGLIENNGVHISRIFGLGVKTIMIDPGHGGTDSGAIGSMGSMEKDLTLDIAKRLRTRLAQYHNFRVIMTREDDRTISLNRRVELAKESKADLFISVHLNYVPSKPINIIETYYFGPSDDKIVLNLAEKENAGSEYGLGEFKKMIEKIGETMKLQESQDLAASIQHKLFANSRSRNNEILDYGVKRAPFVVLLGSEVPAVLVEVSCLSNRKEEIELNTALHRDNIASYLESGVLDYLGKGGVHYGSGIAKSGQ